MTTDEPPVGHTPLETRAIEHVTATPHVPESTYPVVRIGTRVIETVASLALIAWIASSLTWQPMSPERQTAIPLILALVLSYGIADRTTKYRVLSLILRMVALVAGVVAILYMVVNIEAISFRMGLPTELDIWMSWIGIVVLLDFTRRRAGWTLPLVAVAVMAYALAGPYIPGVFGHPGLTWDLLGPRLWYTSDGVFGIALQSMTQLIFLFLFFGSLMEVTGVGRSMMSITARLTGRFRGGAGYTATGTSLLYGLSTGSAVANVAAAGQLTIPLMKQRGYSPKFAAAIEALSSIGGQLSPPVLGASAFLMAEFTHTPYSTIALMALVPCLAFYIAVLAAVTFEARRLDLPVGGADSLAKTIFGDMSPLKQVLDIALFIVPQVVLVWLLAIRVPPGRAAFWACVVLIVGALLTKRDFRLKQLNRAVIGAGRDSLMLFGAVAMIGIVISGFSATGASSKIVELIIDVGGGSLILALVLTAIASIVLGTGLPTLAAYVLLVLLVAPALADLGLPLIVAHWFVFIYAVTSDLTPPTALAPLTASVMAKASFWQTAMTSMRIGVPILVMPFAFAFNPSLIVGGPWYQVAAQSVQIAVAVVVMAAGTIGWRRGGRMTGILERAALWAGGLLGFWSFGWITGVGAALIVAGLVPTLRLWRGGRPPQARTDTPVAAEGAA